MFKNICRILLICTLVCVIVVLVRIIIDFKLVVSSLAAKGEHVSSGYPVNKNNNTLLKIGKDGVVYQLDFSDTIPGTDYDFPHVAMFQGNPQHLHGIVSLENIKQVSPDYDSLAAIVGIVDCSGNTNNVLKVTPQKVSIHTTLQNDSEGGAEYQFARDGLIYHKYANGGRPVYFMLGSDKAGTSRVMELNRTGDTARFVKLLQNEEQLSLPVFSSVTQAKKAGLKTGYSFILQMKINDEFVKTLSFVP